MNIIEILKIIALFISIVLFFVFLIHILEDIEKENSKFLWQIYNIYWDKNIVNILRGYFVFWKKFYKKIVLIKENDKYFLILTNKEREILKLELIGGHLKRFKKDLKNYQEQSKLQKKYSWF